MSTPENESTGDKAPSCEGCKRLEARIQQLELERSDLLLALARERERANALFLAYPPVNAHVAQAQGMPQTLPMRYRVIDALNASLKNRFPDIHRAAKEAGATLLHKLK